MNVFLRTIILLFFVLLNTSIFSQTTVYVCTTNGAYGFCYGTNSTSSCAYNNCIKHGGKTPSVILSHYGKGYGAIAIGKGEDGQQIVGASAGYDNLGDAKIRAKEECARRGGKNIYIERTFHDKKEDEKEEKEKKEEVNEKKKEDDFWSGAEKNNTSSSANKNNDFWDGKGSQSEEANFDKNTVSQKSNQFIGEIESKTKSITIVCRDHGDEDGDRVQIRNNKTIIRSNLYLTNAKKRITVDLNFGMNRLDFKALNQGTAGPNTAEFDIYDDRGKRISTKKWKLLTGFTGTLLIVKL